MPIISGGGSGGGGAVSAVHFSFESQFPQPWTIGEAVKFDTVVFSIGDAVTHPTIPLDGKFKLKKGWYVLQAYIPLTAPNAGGGDLRVKNITTSEYLALDGFVSGIGGEQTVDVALGGVIEAVNNDDEYIIEMSSGNILHVDSFTDARQPNLSIHSIANVSNVVNSINGTPSFARMFSLGTDAEPAGSTTSFQKMAGYANNTALGLTADSANGEITVAENGYIDVSFMLANHDWDGDWFFELAVNDTLTGNNHIFQAPAASTGDVARAHFNPMQVNAGDKISVFYKSTVGDAVDWQSRPAMSMYLDVRILAYQDTITNIINATDPNEYEYTMVEPFASSTVPAIDADYSFNSVGDHQYRFTAGISVANNVITLAKGGMFELKALIKPDITQTGTSDFQFHDGSVYIGSIGTLGANGGDKSLDTTSTAFVNTSANAKNITLKNKAGDAGFSFDTNGTVIIINRVAG
jgi:hypothetical protein